MKKEFNPAIAAPLVPMFDETDVDGSFKAFESVARRNEWPEDQWVSLLVPKLIGKAYRVYNSLCDQNEYKELKQGILDAYAITPDGYRQQFRKYIKPDPHTFVEFASEKLRQLKKMAQGDENYHLFRTSKLNCHGRVEKQATI